MSKEGFLYPVLVGSVNSLWILRSRTRYVLLCQDLVKATRFSHALMNVQKFAIQVIDQ